MIQNVQVVYARPPADGALPDPASTFNVVHTLQFPATKPGFMGESFGKTVVKVR